MKLRYAIPVSIVTILGALFLALLHSLGLNSSRKHWPE